MTESEDTGNGRDDEASRPLFDPARERAIERERARERRDNHDGARPERETDSATAATGANAVSTTEAPGERASPSESRRNSEAGIQGDRTALDSGRPTTGAGSRSRFASASDVTSRGVGLTLLAALLCALGYYGVLGLQAEGVQVFGSVVPPPFYALTFSVLFVFSLVPRAHRGIGALGWSVVFSIVFGSLLAVGTEGVFYLADNPDVATAGYTGLTVLALAVVVASITYWGVLSVAKTA